MAKINFQKLKELLPGLKKDFSLKNFTTFKIGGRAKYLFEAKSKEDLVKAISAAKTFKLPFFILGRGSNLLVSDRKFEGLVIKIANCKFQIADCRILAEAGVPLGKMVRISVENGLSGLEWAIGIPGTVGGAIWGNAGAFGNSMKNVVKEVEVLKIVDCRLQVVNLKNKDCKFGYRESIFKKRPNLIILSAILQLKKEKKSEIKRKIREYFNYRRKTQPLNFPSVGSVFKNPLGFSAAKLIEECGLKGKIVGGAKISEKHANFILNFRNGKAKDVLKLIRLVKQRVKKKFKISLKEEIQYLDFKK